VYWLKFHLKFLRNGNFNFNIIPSGDDVDRPSFYAFIIKVVKEIKSLDQDYIKNVKKYTRKYSYVCFRKKYEEDVSCEKQNRNVDWKQIYRSVNDKKMTPEMRTFNFRSIHNGLSFPLKFPKAKKYKCTFCNKAIETMEHLFVECEVTGKMYDKIKTLLSCNLDIRVMDRIVLCVDLEFGDIKILSAYRMSIWRVKALIAQGDVRDPLNIFHKVFKHFNR